MRECVNACAGAAANGNRYFTSTTPGSDKMMSLALAAMMAGKKVNVLLSGCYGNAHSVITGIVVKAQRAVRQVDQCGRSGICSFLAASKNRS